MLPLIVVLGPTGSGKTDLAIRIASTFQGEILNFDSVQVHRGLDVGSAKVPLGERGGIPHHLLDIVGPDEELTAGDFARRARAVLEQLKARGSLPILVGGTGFYLRALLQGLSPAPGRDNVVRVRLERIAGRRPGALHRFVQRYDQQAALRIHPNDHQKLIRAVELMVLNREPATATQSRPREALAGYSILKLGLTPDRAELRERIDRRSAQMFQAGLLEETRTLLDAGVNPNSKALLSLGYKQAVAVLEGVTSLRDAITDCRTKTRQYAKRQMTWFRAEPGVKWLHGFGGDLAIQAQALDLVTEFMHHASPERRSAQGIES